MMNTPRSLTRAALLSLTLALGLPCSILAPTVASAQDRGPVQRVLKGTVEGKDGGRIKGAVVYLRDGRSSAVKSAITLDDGTYRFVQLSQGVDYDVWAQMDGKKSKTKSISSFDSKTDLNIALTID